MGATSDAAADPPADTASVSPPSSPRSGAQTADVIAECAAALFADKGYAATSIREIAEAAKVTKPTLYYHFGSKDGLISHLIEGTLSRYADTLRALSLRTDFEAALIELAKDQLEFASSYPATMTLLIRLDVQRPANLSFDLDTAHLENHMQLERFFANAITAKVLSGKEPRFLALSYAGLIFPHLIARVRFPSMDCGSDDDIATNLVSLLFDGARASDPES